MINPKIVYPAGNICFESETAGEIRADLDTTVLARNLMSVSTSMLNIELSSENLRFTFSDMRLQFEQYYLLIKR